MSNDDVITTEERITLLLTLSETASVARAAAVAEAVSSTSFSASSRLAQLL